MITVGKWTYSQKGSTKNLMEWEESMKNRARVGFLADFEKLQSKGTRDFQGISTRLDGSKSHQRVLGLQQTSGWIPKKKNTKNGEIQAPKLQ